MAAVTRREYSGNAGATTLSSSISNSDTSIAVDDGSGFPTGTNPFFIVIGRGTSTEEKILCSGRSGNTITASSRGADDTSAASHDAGEAVEHVWTAQDADDVNKVAAALTTKGDLLGFGTEPTRVPIGADGKFLVADSGDAEGVAWGGDHGNLAGLTDDDHTQYAKLAGDTFTGAVTFQDGMDGQLSSNTHAVTDGPSAWPTGLSWQRVSSGSWPSTTGTAVTYNLGDTYATFQTFINAADPDAMQFRRWDSGTSSWTDWNTVTIAENPGTWEVDGSTEVASHGTFTTSYATVASVSLTIPSGWGSYKIEAYATYAVGSDDSSQADKYDAVISIGGSRQQAQENMRSGSSSSRVSHNIGGRRTGMSSTGAVSVLLEMRESAIASNTATPSAHDVYLYARAVRTS